MEGRPAYCWHGMLKHTQSCCRLSAHSEGKTRGVCLHLLRSAILLQKKGEGRAAFPKPTSCHKLHFSPMPLSMHASLGWLSFSIRELLEVPSSAGLINDKVFAQVAALLMIYLVLIPFCLGAGHGGIQDQLPAGSCGHGRGTATCHPIETGAATEQGQPIGETGPAAVAPSHFHECPQGQLQQIGRHESAARERMLLGP